MNYLAHVFLSGEDPDWQLGGYLGDFVKGSLEHGSHCEMGQAWALGVVCGMQLHRYIDAEVDRQLYFRKSINSLDPELRRVAGIAMDVFYDHLLARHWDDYCDRPLLQFSRDFYRVCLSQDDRLPESAKYFIGRAAKADLFSGYQNREIYRQVIERISLRLKSPVLQKNLIKAGDQILDNYSLIEKGFHKQFPLLIDLAANRRQVLSKPSFKAQ